MGKITGNWIPEENLLPLCLLLSRQISYDFGPTDWKAIQYGIHGTSVDRKIWFSYVLSGKLDIELHLASEDGTALISFELELAENLVGNFDFMVGVLQEFIVTSRTFDPSR